MSGKVGLVCIIDDDKIYRFTTEKYIQMLNLSDKVLTFSDGEEAIEYLQSNLENTASFPDVILLDVNMPIMDGWDFLEEYSQFESKIPKSVKIYMVSSSIDERDQNRSREYSQITEYITKPITEEHLMTLITKG